MNKYLRYLTMCLLLLIAPALSNGQEVRDAIPGEIILRLAPGASIHTTLRTLYARRLALSNQISVRALGQLHPIYLLQFPTEKIAAPDMLQQIRQLPGVLAAQYNYEVEFRQTPNDPNYERQWGLQRIGMPAAWEYTSGGLTERGDTIVVAILDAGFDVAHEDLRDNVWFNRFEIPNDGIDNDENGYVDDIVGWDFMLNSNNHSLSSHGTAVAGILGAKGNNNIGVTGVNWNIKLMLLTISRVDQIISAYEYVIEQRKRYNDTNGAKGAFVVATNASFGQERRFCAEQPVWGGMYDLLGEVGILTGAGTVNRDFNVDEVGDMPTTCPSDFIITCLNVTPKDELFFSSGFGAVSIDLGAPGEGSYSLLVGNRYGPFGNNSAAAPHLTGVIAMLYALPCKGLSESAIRQPAQTALLIRDAIINGVEPLPALQGKTATGGLLSLPGSMRRLQSSCQSTSGELALLNIFPNPAKGKVVIEYETPDFEPYDILIFNALGQLVFRNGLRPPSFAVKREQIDVNGWSSGLYVIILQRGTQVVKAKFVVH